MLIVISDLHLVDGTCGKPISASAFQLFAARLNELAFNASWRADKTYRPLNGIDILLLGDILDPQHSTLWLDTHPGATGYVRPWTDFRLPEYAKKLNAINQAILNYNAEATGILRHLAGGNAILLPPADRRGRASFDTQEQVAVPVRIHYMAGNHDWYYHLPGPAFDQIRQEIIQAMGLANPSSPFPHEVKESETLRRLFAEYKIYAQHGDLYDSFNYSKDKGRDAATLGDAFAVEVLNRFPVEAQQRLGQELPKGILDSLSELVNVRPALATPLWISSQLRQNNISPADQKKIKEVWDEMGNEFLALPFVREADRKFKFDLVDGLELIVKLTDRFSFKNIDDVVVWMRKQFWSEELTFAKHALREHAFLNRSAKFIVYGHTHHHEIVPLDSIPTTPHPTNQMYLNSGTWHSYYDLAVFKPEEQKFIPYQVLTYLSFFKDDERDGRRFETWSGAFSD
ncbi:MAG: hypothetical protein QMD04_08625 [Anaerolineales bacterium]|nr:hypothetical protein [Anaerolineales bacterium]